MDDGRGEEVVADNDWLDVFPTMMTMRGNKEMKRKNKKKKKKRK